MARYDVHHWVVSSSSRRVLAYRAPLVGFPNVGLAAESCGESKERNDAAFLKRN